MRTCESCGEVIPRARLKALPDTTRCVNCSKEKRVEGVLEFGHKTAGVLVLLPKDPEQRRLALRAHNRGR